MLLVLVGRLVTSGPVLSDLLVCLLQIEALKVFTREELISWFWQHRGVSARKLSVHVSTGLRRLRFWFCVLFLIS